MHGARAWLALGPVVLVGVLAAHELAYRLTGTAGGPEHDYLAHVPQVLLVLVLVGLATVRLGTRVRLPAAWQLPVAAVATFVVQEHVERLVHTGSVPWLLTSPVFLVGLVLQLPVALLAWCLTRGALDALAARPLSRPSRGRGLVLDTPDPAARVVRAAAVGARSVRGPPLALRP